MALLTKLSGFSRSTPLVLFALCMSWSAIVAAASPAPSAARDGYEYYAIGDPAAVTPGRVEPGLMLVGGGPWPYDAFRWMIQRSGHGHIVVLRASGAAEAQDEFYNDIGGIASAQTFVFHDRKAASDPVVLAAIHNADGIFIAGGDQSNYVRYWKGTPVNDALDRHVRAGKPLGGTSAGLAILGAWAYGAMDGGSMTSDVALRDPLDPGMTLVGDFLHLRYLEQVITDSHFGKRDRLGRLIAFVANLRSQGAAKVVGLGIDEGAALCIDGDGMARLYPGAENGRAWLVQPTQPAGRVESGQPLDYAGVRITGVGPDSRLNLQDFSVESPAFQRIADVREGRLTVRESQAPRQAAAR